MGTAMDRECRVTTTAMQGNRRGREGQTKAQNALPVIDGSGQQSIDLCHHPPLPPFGIGTEHTSAAPDQKCQSPEPFYSLTFNSVPHIYGILRGEILSRIFLDDSKTISPPVYHSLRRKRVGVECLDAHTLSSPFFQ